LIGRLERDPAVAGLTVQFPTDWEHIEFEGIGSPVTSTHRTFSGTAGVEHVDAHFFALYDMPIMAGRAFVQADTRAGATAIIVNQVFAADHLGSGPVLGRRLRFIGKSDTAGAAEAGPWLDIVGVVRDFAELSYEPSGRIYLPADVAQLSPPIDLAVRTRRTPATRFAPRLREIAAAVDPALQVSNLIGEADRHRLSRRFLLYLAIGTTAAMLSVVLLSAAGIYAMMSFTVARRRREIGIRSALGADPRRLLSSIFARASAQLGAGIVLGLIGTVALDRVMQRGPVHDGNVIALPFVAALMIVVGLLAAIGPARRGLAVQPSEALREE
jgi:hypothetical protein